MTQEIKKKDKNSSKENKLQTPKNVWEKKAKKNQRDAGKGSEYQTHVVYKGHTIER